MTTQQTTWTKYDGSDEQIAEIKNASNGYVLKSNAGTEKTWTEIFTSDIDDYLDATSYYWIIPEDPLREMKIRWAQTGQPVWIKEIIGTGEFEITAVYQTTAPDWELSNAEYRFTPWED